MYKMCENCGFMYDDSCGACPQCNNGSANQPNGQKTESGNNTFVSQSFGGFQSSASVSSNTSRSSKSSGGGISKPLIAVLAVGLAGVIVAIGAVLVVGLIKGDQLPNDGSNYADEYVNDHADDFQDVGGLSDESTSEFSVSFDPSNGDPVKQIVMSPGYIVEPETPVRDGYVFDGWYDLDLENEWDFANDEAHESMTLYAKWIKETGENEKLVLAVDGLRLRETPDLSGKKIGLIPNGTRVIIENTVDGWSYTTYKGQSGWCSSEFLYNPADYEGEVLFKAYVDNKNGLTLYVNEHTDSTIINDNISYKSTVYVYEVDDEWSYVRYGDEYGWCLSEYLDDYR